MNKPPAWGFSIFCDDMRQELFGKYSLLGIYHADIVIPEGLPALLPKFVIVVRYFETPGEMSTDLNININVPWKEGSIATQSIKREDMVWSPNRDFQYGSDDSEPVFTLLMPFVFSPFVIEEPGRIRVRGTLGNEVIKLGSLYIRKVIPGEMPENPGS
jgi:hypothetical protein